MFGFGIFGFILLALVIFWLWMLIDVLSNQEKDKIVWFLVVFFLNGLGAILYYFIARKQRLNEA